MTEFLKLNIVATQFSDTMETGIGLILRDDTGVFVSCRVARFSGSFRADEAELLGLYEGLVWVQELGLHKIELEMDSLAVVNAIQCRSVDHTTFGNLIRDCLDLINTIGVCYVSHNSRTANVARTL